MKHLCRQGSTLFLCPSDLGCLNNAFVPARGPGSAHDVIMERLDATAKALARLQALPAAMRALEARVDQVACLVAGANIATP